MSDDNIKARKDSHLDLAFNPALQSANPTGFDRVLLTHQALPEMAMHDVDISAQFLGKPVSMPLLIGAMTGRTPAVRLLTVILRTWHKGMVCRWRLARNALLLCKGRGRICAILPKPCR